MDRIDARTVLPQVTRAGRAQRHADVLARCITAASTPEQAERYRRCYHRAAARAAALTRTDISTGRRELTLAFLRAHHRFLAFIVTALIAEFVFAHVAPAWLQSDVRWLTVGLYLGALAMWVATNRTAGREVDTYEDYGEPADDC